jgi:hypothetical protein
MRAGFGLALLAGILTGCATPEPEVKIEYRTVPVPVSVGCVVDKPAPVRPLNKQIAPEQWETLAPGAKAEAVKAQAGERMNYSDELEASTSGCKNAEPGK